MSASVKLQPQTKTKKAVRELKQLRSPDRQKAIIDSGRCCRSCRCCRCF